MQNQPAVGGQRWSETVLTVRVWCVPHRGISGVAEIDGPNSPKMFIRGLIEICGRLC